MRISTMYICLENESTYTELSAPNILPLAADFPHPVPKVSTIDIIGGNGSLDISDAATGECNFQTVKGTISLVIPDGANVDATIDAIYRKYHGRRCKVKFTSAGKYRVGRIWVNADDENRSKRVIKLTMNADPFWISDKTASVTHSDGQNVWNKDYVTLSGGSLHNITADGFSAYITENMSNYTAEFSLPGQSQSVYLLSFDAHTSFAEGSGSFQLKIYHGETLVQTIPFNNGDYRAIVVKPSDNLKLNFSFWTISSSAYANVGLRNIKLFETAGYTVTNGGDIRIIPTVTASNGAATVYAEGVQKHFADGESGVFWDFPLSPGANAFGIIPDTVGEHPTLSFSFKEEYL